MPALQDLGALIGDDFLRRLQKDRTPSASEDVQVREIETALRLQVTIYPFLFGARDMPGAEQLPESIKGFAKRQAIFAREPAFDTAMVVLGNALRSDHRLGPAPAGRDRRLPLLGTLSPPQALALASISAVALWFIGSSIPLLAALPGHDTSPLQLEFWRAAKYLLLTTLIGLGPYASYWLVAVPRARARLPIRDFGGLLSAFNIGAALVLGGSFLLLALALLANQLVRLRRGADVRSVVRAARLLRVGHPMLRGAGHAAACPQRRISPLASSAAAA